MYRNKGLQLLVFLVSLIVTHAGASSTQPIKEATWKAACAVAADLEKIQQRAAQMLKLKITGAANYLAQAYKTQIYIELKKSGNYRKIDLALIDYYMRRANVDLATASGATLTASASAAAKAARFQGAIQEYVQMMAQIADSSTNSCLGGSGGARTGASAAALTVNEEGCKPTDGDITPAAAGTQHFADHGITHTELAKATSATAAAGAADCALTTNKASSYLLDADGGTSAVDGEPIFAGGLFKLGSDLLVNSPHQITTTSAKYLIMKGGHTAYLATKDIGQGYAFKGPTELAGDADFRNAYRKEVLGDTKLEKPEAPVEPNAVETAFGSQMETEYKDFPDTKVIDLTGKESNGKELNTINDLGELDRVLKHYQQARVTSLNKEITNLKEQLKNLGAKGYDKTPEQICNAIGDKNETGCNKTPGCQFVSSNAQGKKCTLNPEAAKKVAEEAGKATAKDGKTTNTTWSNSFIINKVPLLLAFLILE